MSIDIEGLNPGVCEICSERRVTRNDKNICYNCVNKDLIENDEELQEILKERKKAYGNFRY